MIDQRDVKLLKKSIIRCLTTEFQHGNQTNVPIFNAAGGHATYHGIDLDLVVDKIVLGINLARNEQQNGGKSV